MGCPSKSCRRSSRQSACRTITIEGQPHPTASEDQQHNRHDPSNVTASEVRQSLLDKPCLDCMPLRVGSREPRPRLRGILAFQAPILTPACSTCLMKRLRRFRQRRRLAVGVRRNHPDEASCRRNRRPPRVSRYLNPLFRIGCNWV